MLRFVFCAYLSYNPRKYSSISAAYIFPDTSYTFVSYPAGHAAILKFSLNLPHEACSIGRIELT